MDNVAVRGLLAQGDSSRGWGKHQTVDIGGEKVFVKSVPMTDLEYANAFSTRNLYDLPLHYNYGVGSAGFGVFRELLTHVKTTNWVLSGATSSFPLLYGFRLLPFSEDRTVIDAQRRNGYVTYWAGNENIGRYFDDRMMANYELALFLEYVPHVLHPWLVQYPARCHEMLEDLRDAITFLRTRGIVHFDAHYFNVLTDGEHVFVSDFGLALDRNFDLATDELEFLRHHEYYDYGEILWSLGQALINMYNNLPEDRRRMAVEQCGIPRGSPPMGALVSGVQQLSDVVALDKSLVDAVVKYRDVILLMNDFYTSMHTNNKKDTRLDLLQLRELLVRSQFVE